MEVKAICYIICPCGEKHLLRSGIDAPVYWCGSTLKNLQEGDEVEYEEEDTLASMLKQEGGFCESVR